MKSAVFWVKFIHAIIFLLLLTATGIVVFSAVTGHINAATWLSFGSVVVEGIILMMNKWICPLTTFAEKLGAESGTVADLFFPRWLADRIFSINGTIFVVASVILVYRMVQ